MKAIIDGRLYDTGAPQTRAIASFSNGLFRDDLDYCASTLYRTGRGNYFIVGKGGPRSIYSRVCGSNSVCGGSAMRAVTLFEAKEYINGMDPDDVDMANAPELSAEPA